MKHILSFSGGKDSTYLAIYLVENSYPLDEAVMFDTGWEFPQMYKHIEKLLKLELMMKGLSDEKPLKQLTGGAGGV